MEANNNTNSITDFSSEADIYRPQSVGQLVKIFVFQTPEERIKRKYDLKRYTEGKETELEQFKRFCRDILQADDEQRKERNRISDIERKNQLRADRLLAMDNATIAVQNVHKSLGLSDEMKNAEIARIHAGLQRMIDSWE